MFAWRPTGWAMLSVALGVMLPRAAEARDPIPVIQIEYRAGPGCPDEAAFLANVREKVAFEPARSGVQAARTFAVTLDRTSDAPASYRGALHVTSGSRPASIRRVEGVYCAEVAEAIAVIIAIELGPEQRIDEAPPDAPRAGPSPKATPPSRWRFGVAADLAMTSALADGISPEARLAVVLRRGSAGLLSPSFRLGPTFADGARRENTAGTVELRLVGGALEACPIRASLTTDLSLEPCGRIALARRTADGGPPSNPEAETSTGFWADAGALVRAAFDATDVWWLELSVEGFVPLVRDRFYSFSSNITLFEIPAAGARAAVGVGARF